MKRQTTVGFRDLPIFDNSGPLSKEEEFAKLVLIARGMNTEAGADLYVRRIGPNSARVLSVRLLAEMKGGRRTLVHGVVQCVIPEYKQTHITAANGWKYSAVLGFTQNFKLERYEAGQQVSLLVEQIGQASTKVNAIAPRC